MYRARVQAVSGSKVFADGKWLRCIGNKPVSVGERVWTDGRVVFGNYTIPQTPLIIPQQQEETVIPIVTDEGYFVFSKRKLKPCSSEKPLPDYNFFINNERANCYFVENYLGIYPASSVYYYDAYEAYARKIYGDNVPLTIELDDYSCKLKGILAANVDKEGNLFAIAIDQLALKIIKNMETVNAIDLKPLAEEAKELAAIPSPPAPLDDWGTSGDEESPGDWMIWHLYNTSTHLTVLYAFIENENNWTVYIEFFTIKDAQTTHGDWEEGLSNITETSVNCYLSNHGTDLNIGSENSYFDDYISVVPFDQCPTTPDPDYKLPLQDGYYYTEKLNDRKIYITIYSPNGKEIFSNVFDFFPVILAFLKIKGGFLLNIYENKKNRLYFLAQNQTLLTENACHNFRLRPIKKNKKNWPNRIKTISFED